MRYKLDLKRDIDPDGDEGYILCLPFGYRFYDDLVHVRGFDTIREIKRAAREDVIVCTCQECLAAKSGSAPI